MSGVVIAVIIATYAALLAYYCILEKRERFWPATILKVIISAYAAGICVFSAIVLDNIIFYIFALGLVFAVPADFFLQYIKSDLTKYRIGISLFGAMHICLLISFFLADPIPKVYEFIIFAVFIATLLIFQIKGKWKMGKEKTQLTVYTVFVVFMSAKAISTYIVAPSSFTLALALGGLFFFISDLFLGIWAYSTERFVYLALNRTTYFIGQLSLAFYLFLMVIG